MFFVDDFVEYMQYVGEYTFRIPKRYLKDVENPLEFFDDEQFFISYRFSKRTFVSEIFPLVEGGMQSFDLRGHPLPPIIKALSVLRFYVTGNYQADTGHLHCMSQSTMSLLVKKVSLLLAQQLHNVIKFPTHTEIEGVNRLFYNMAGFPGVVGCIDCTHIPIQNPHKEGGENFRNRKGNFSINVQVVSGPNGEIFDIVARWPGSTRDFHIFENSSVKMKFEQQQIQGILLGDSGYVQTQYLFTPFLNPQEPTEVRYNNSHAGTICTVERLFSLWKKRFSCLRRKLSNKVATTTHIIAACAVLHNIAVKCGEQLPPEGQKIDVFENDDPEPIHPNVHDHRRGAIIRMAYIAKYFKV